MQRPSVYRPHGTAQLWAQLPYGPDNRVWLHEVCGARARLEWDSLSRTWHLARAHFRPLVDALVTRYGEVDVRVDISAADRCDARCVKATGDECTCSCFGENHGGAGYWKNWTALGEPTPIPGQAGIYRRLWVAHSTVRL